MSNTTDWDGTLEIIEGCHKKLEEVLQKYSDEDYLDYLGIRDDYLGASLSNSKKELKIMGSNGFDEEVWELFANDIKECVEGDIKFSDEGHFHWVYRFKNKHFEIIDGYVIFGDIYSNFIEAYDDKLPPDLKKELEKWYCAINI